MIRKIFAYVCAIWLVLIVLGIFSTVTALAFAVSPWLGAGVAFTLVAIFGVTWGIDRDLI